MRADTDTTATTARGEREGGRLVAIGVFFAFTVAVVLGAAFWNPSSSVMSRRAGAATTADDDLTTGSIVFVPTLGDRCRSSLIDNATWHIRDNGTVDCREALARNANTDRVQWSSPRIDVIRQGFTGR